MSLLLALLAGGLTTLSPCVLPVLPFIALAALDEHRYGPVALAAGLTLSFTAAGVVLAGAGWALGGSADHVRMLFAALMVVIGVILLSPMLQARFAGWTEPLVHGANGALARFTPSGVAGQFMLGVLLGVVWTPCSGPTLGAAITLAADNHSYAKAALVMLAFSIGACLPLLAIANGSRQTLKGRRDALAKLNRVAKPILGGVLMVLGLVILTGMDRRIEAALVQAMPDWLTILTTRF